MEACTAKRVDKVQIPFITWKTMQKDNRSMQLWSLCTIENRINDGSMRWKPYGLECRWKAEIAHARIPGDCGMGRGALCTGNRMGSQRCY